MGESVASSSLYNDPESIPSITKNVIFWIEKKIDSECDEMKCYQADYCETAKLIRVENEVTILYHFGTLFCTKCTLFCQMELFGLWH